MTRQEVVALKKHNRVKYIGSDPKVLEQLKKRAPKAALTKGLVIDYVSDYSKSSYVDDQRRDLIIRTWNAGFYEKVVPADWVVLDARRTDLVRSREKRKVKYTDKYVRDQLDRFTKQFEDMQGTKDSIDNMLNDIPLSDRLRILTTLSEDQKAWLQLVSMDPKEVLGFLKEFALREPDDVPEVTDGSNGSDVPVSSETPVCPS